MTSSATRVLLERSSAYQVWLLDEASRCSCKYLCVSVPVPVSVFVFVSPQFLIILNGVLNVLTSCVQQ